MAPILGVLKEIALAPFKGAIAVDACTSVVKEEDTLSFFPSLPRIRNRRHYEADVDRKSKVQLCTKGYNAHPSLTPGIFTLFCPHGMFLLCSIYIMHIHISSGICYGFEAMRLHESPNTPFSILYERFPEGKLPNMIVSKCMHTLTGPSKLIYDNGCNLHNYCLNREPDFFMKTRFFVDRFHWKNHTGK